MIRFSLFCLSVISGVIWAAPASAQTSPALKLAPNVRPLPHNYMGPFVTRQDGAIVAVEPQESIVSHDGGKTWEKSPLFTAEQQKAQPLNVRGERAMIGTRSGALIVAFINDKEKKWTWKNELGDAPGAILPTYAMRSLDGGRTWQDIQKLHDDWSGAVRDMIQTKEGLVIFTAMKMLHNPGRHSVLTYWSDDDGKTWHPSNLIDLGGKGHHGGVTEPTLVELADGRVWMLIRTNWGEFWSAWSPDGGRTWRVLEPSGIAASSAPAVIKRLASGKLALVWNRLYPEGKNEYPLSGGDGLWSEVPVSNFREELSLAFSSDEGKTWGKPTVIARASEKGTVGASSRWISYPYVFEPKPGTLWITTMQGGLCAELQEADFVGK